MDSLLREARQALEASESRHLPMSYRLRIYDSLLETHGADEGAWRYAALCFFSACETLPFWDRVQSKDDYRNVPRQYLQVAQCALLGFADREALIEHYYQLPIPEDAGNWWLKEWSGDRRGFFAPLACTSASESAIDRFFREVYSESDTERNLEYSDWDTHAFVALDRTGDSRHFESHPDVLYPYWIQFLTQDVPRVLADQRLVRTLIKEVRLGDLDL